MLSAIHQNYLQSVNNLSIKNIGLTGKNPSVACLIVDYSKSPKGIVLSYGLTSKNGRPHAEINALNKLSKKEQLEVCNLLSRGGLPGDCAAAVNNYGVCNVTLEFWQ